MNKTQKALRMAIEVLPELISQAQCEFDSQHKAYEGYPAMYYRYGYLKELADDGTKTLETCKEALENYRTKKSLAKIKLDFIKNQLDNLPKNTKLVEILEDGTVKQI